MSRSAHRIIVSAVWWAPAFALLTAAPAAGADGFVNVRDHLPARWPVDGSVDLRAPIQKVLDAHAMVFFPGSDDPAKPLVYPTSTGLIVRPNCRIRLGANAWLKRLPSAGQLIELKDGARMTGGIIDGNKYAHWPEFPNLGKTDAAVRIRNHCVVEDVVVFNNPGIAFFSTNSHSKVYRCLAENVGYIDVKFGVTYWRSKWDRYSGDGFYFRGTGNLIKDCEAYDCFRWDYCSSHSGARQNSYVDCKGGDVNLRTYGFIDIEAAYAGNRLIRCVSPNSRLVTSRSAHLEILQCMASYIYVNGAEWPKGAPPRPSKSPAPRIDGCITTNGGIIIGGQDATGRQDWAGASSPIVTNNRMYLMQVLPQKRYSQWSFYVHSTDGAGIVANNVLYEYDDGKARGPGMRLDNVKGRDNSVLYGRWDLKLATPSLRYGYIDPKALDRHRRRKAMAALKSKKASLGISGPIASVVWLADEVPFVRDGKEQGEAAGWAARPPDGEGRVLKMRVGSHWTNQHKKGGFDRFLGPGWYYFSFPWPEVKTGQTAHLLLSAIDSEARIFLNGRLVGSHSGWKEPAAVRLKNSWRRPEGKQMLAVKVWTTSGLAGLYGPVAIVIEGAAK